MILVCYSSGRPIKESKEAIKAIHGYLADVKTPNPVGEMVSPPSKDDILSSMFTWVSVKLCRENGVVEKSGMVNLGGLCVVTQGWKYTLFMQKRAKA